MSSQTDKAKGRIKEAAGDLTDDESLKREGQADQAGAKVKETAERAHEKVDEMVDKAKDKMHQRD